VTWGGGCRKPLQVNSGRGDRGRVQTQKATEDGEGGGKTFLQLWSSPVGNKKSLGGDDSGPNIEPVGRDWGITKNSLGSQFVNSALTTLRKEKSTKTQIGALNLSTLEKRGTLGQEPVSGCGGAGVQKKKLWGGEKPKWGLLLKKSLGGKFRTSHASQVRETMRVPSFLPTVIEGGLFEPEEDLVKKRVPRWPQRLAKKPQKDRVNEPEKRKGV